MQRIIEVTLFVDLDVESTEVTLNSYSIAGGTSADLQIAAQAMSAAIPQVLRDAAKLNPPSLVAKFTSQYTGWACSICGSAMELGFGVVALEGVSSYVCEGCIAQLDPRLLDLAEVLDSYDEFLHREDDDPASTAVYDFVGGGVKSADYTAPSLIAAITQVIERTGGKPPSIDDPDEEHDTSGIDDFNIDDILL